MLKVIRFFYSQQTSVTTIAAENSRRTAQEVDDMAPEPFRSVHNNIVSTQSFRQPVDSYGRSGGECMKKNKRINPMHADLLLECRMDGAGWPVTGTCKNGVRSFHGRVQPLTFFDFLLPPINGWTRSIISSFCMLACKCLKEYTSTFR